MLKACRTCLSLIDVDSLPFYEIEDEDVQLSEQSCRYKLLSVIPKMALDITPKSMLCGECHDSLEALFGFKEKCLKTENIITQYLQAKPDLDIKNFNLKDVSAFRAADIHVSDDEVVEAEPIKDDVVICDTVITNLKDEVSDFLLGSIEVAQPLPGPPNIRVSKEEAIEMSVEDDAVKEDMEVCDTVITNFKDEVSGFLFGSMEVAQPLPGSSANIRISEDEAIETSVEDDAVKEEMDSVEVEQPKTAVPGFSAGIRISEDQAVDVSVEDDAINEKVELSNTVIKKKTYEFDDYDYDLKFLCKYCHKRFKYAAKLKIHLRTHTGEKPYRCKTCDHCFAEKSGLKKHMTTHTAKKRTHTGAKPYRCKTCDHCFAQKDALKSHMKTHTGEKPHRCSICDKRFGRSGHLTAHLCMHSGKWPFVCTICDKGWSSNSELTVHMRRHTGEKPYRCKTCDHCFSQKVHLKNHLLTHTGEKPHRCEMCHRCFAQKSALTSHFLTHTGEKPYRCEMCHRCFAKKSWLTSHLRTHTGEKPYRCETCDRSFTHRMSLTTHLRLHTGERPYVCTVCDKGFSLKSNLNKHMRTHNKEQPHQCKKDSRSEELPVPAHQHGLL